MNNIDLSVAMATAPSSAFEELRVRPRFWFPLLILTATTVGLAWWYYSVVDIEWFKDIMFGNNPAIQALSEEDRAARMSMVTRSTMLWSSVVGGIFALPIAFLISSLYLLLAAKVTKLPQGFKHWYAFSCWSSLPMLVSTVVAAIFLLMSDNGQVSPSMLQPLSLNELVFHRPMGSPGQGLLESLNLTSVWGWILMIIGVRVWSQRSWTFASLFILLPVVVVYGIWAFFAFR
jgi:Yip1 domain